MKSYQMLHAVEKPMNLDYVKPFANTSDLVNFTPNIHEQVAEAKEKERIYAQKHGQEEGEGEVETQTIVLEEEKAGESAASMKTKKSKFDAQEEKQA